MHVRPATEEDLPGIAAIYGHEAGVSVSTFDLVARPVGHWRERMLSPEAGDHLLVAVEEGRLLGFAYSSAYRPRPGFRFARETALYLDRAARGRGVGRVLYADLLLAVRASGIRTMLAIVALPNEASERLHLALGFERVGEIREVGWKFGRWVDVAWYELR